MSADGDVTGMSLEVVQFVYTVRGTCQSLAAAAAAARRDGVRCVMTGYEQGRRQELSRWGSISYCKEEIVVCLIRGR